MLSSRTVTVRATAIGSGYRVFVMNGDGSGLRQVTFSTGLSRPDFMVDINPVISPDGSRVAFVSRRSDVEYTPGSGSYRGISDIFIINTDGTELHQVTTSQINYGGGPGGSFIRSVAWSPDGTKLAFRGLRQTTVNGQLGFHEVVGTINAGGTNEQVLKVVDAPGVGEALDWSRPPQGSPVGPRIFYAGDANWDPNMYHFIDLNAGGESSIATSALERPSAGAGTVRFSPDGQRIIYTQDNANYTGANPAIMNLDGTGKTILTGINLGRGEPLWWTGGEPIPAPARLELSPNPVYVRQGMTAQVTPTLFDAAGNVIVRAATGWTIDPNNAGSPTVSTTGEVASGSGEYTYTLTANNGGMTAATTTVIVDNTPPTAPANLTANAAGASQIDLSWTTSTDNVGVVSYAVYRSTALDGPFSRVLTVPDTVYGAVYAQDTGLSAATTYFYKVLASDAAGNPSPFSNITSATTTTDQAGGAAISGVVRGEASGGPMEPLSGAVVLLSGPRGDRITTDVYGHYEFSVLPQGPYGLQVEAPAGQELTYVPQWMDNVYYDGSTPVTRNVDLARADVAGVVVKSDGSSAGNTRIDIYKTTNGGPSQYTGRSTVTEGVYGRFQFDLPPDFLNGNYFLRAEPAEGSSDLTSSLAAPFNWPPSGDRPIRFTGTDTLRLRRVTVSGAVYQPDGVTFAGDVSVLAFTSGQTQGESVDGTISDHVYGTYRLALNPGSYVLVARPPQGSGLAESNEVLIELNDPNSVVSGQALVLRNPLPPSFKGTVVGPTGLPVAGAFVNASAPNGGPGSPGTGEQTKSDGRLPPPLRTTS
ncbi:MAG: hypothetical protein M1598_05225 [Actinobacteria bacterium]|nr:hypothetical protein [Actinomycetota bacterium]